MKLCTLMSDFVAYTTTTELYALFNITVAYSLGKVFAFGRNWNEQFYDNLFWLIFNLCSFCT